MKQQKPIEMIPCARCGVHVPRHETTGNANTRVCQPCFTKLMEPKRPESSE